MTKHFWFPMGMIFIPILLLFAGCMSFITAPPTADDYHINNSVENTESWEKIKKACGMDGTLYCR